ncbi:MAG: TaqI-like C-terminal specificity domain-containing protein [Pseudodesulfovibrio sp.]|uniref:Eco57I restriction-modification methylase domain-containing protein n=1 Tax=Pseudodesulfovibrio sp. TaxID=2035812 RepID=UPI003D0F8C65
MKVGKLSKHAEWLSLIEISGPFLTVSMLEKAFPQGLEAVETPRRQRLRAAYEEWREAVDQEDNLLPELHREWVRLVLTELLEYDQESLVHADDWPGELPSVSSQEHAGEFKPDWIVHTPGDGKPRLFIAVLPPDTDLESVQRGDGWPISLQERMTLLCRAHGVRVGLLIDGERWMLVNAPVGSTSSQASWYARLWFQEPITLKAFQSLLGVRRCFGPAEDTLESLLDESLKHHEEVTDTLGEQVRRAVEVLVQCLDKADEDRNRELLRDVKPAELYEAGLTVMMRLVFVLCAEERGLLLLGDSVYDRCYAVSTLRGQLEEEAYDHGPEVLDRRHDAWTRLLAVFRAVYGGIEHESLRLPALGGSLFDPDRFPFLEGRAKGTSWRDTSASPLPIDNRTVLLLLNSLQILEQSGGALLLSYRALDVEQIGHVYEGLLEHTVARVPRVTLGLQGSKKAKNPNVILAELESARLEGTDSLVKLVEEITKRGESAIRNDLSIPADDMIFGRALGVCGGDTGLAERIRPFTNLLRTDAWDDPIVYRDNSFMVTLGADRRETGTHYTPKSLTESIVTTTLEPVVYAGPAEGKPREEWTLKSSREILDLKVCDPAMGSGAFLVQACRYLGEKLVEAWRHEEAAGKAITVDGEALDQIGAEEPLTSQLDERLTIARRLVAEHCLYGVDINPLAVELAKLSIWLVTLAKGRPFGFLDHNLRSGDSLLGIHRLEQLTRLRMDTESGRQYQLRIFGQNVEAAVNEAIELRKRLRATTIRDIRDVEAMARLDREARRKLESVELVADAMIGEALRCGDNQKSLNVALDSLAVLADEFLSGGKESAIHKIRQIAHGDKSAECGPRPFHWPIEFTEVFLNSSGFDAVVGNPPFIPITGIEWDIRRFIEAQYECAVGRHNTFSSFAERALKITSTTSSVGIVVPDRLFLNIQYEILRKHIFDRVVLSHIFDFAGAFKATVDAVAIIGHKKRSNDTIKVIRKNKESGFFEEKVSSQNALLSAYDGAINIYVDPKDADIYSRVKTKSVQLGDIAEIKDGIIQGAVADLLFLDEPEDECSKKLLFGGDVHRYSIQWSRKYVNYNPDELMKIEIERRGPKKRPGLWMRNAGIFEKKKILTRQTSDRIIAAIDSHNFYYANTLHGTSLGAESIGCGYSLEFIAGLLNSKLINFIYAVIAGEVGKTFAQIKIDTLKKIPIFSEPNNEMAVQIKTLVSSMANDSSDRDLAKKEIDALVFRLFDLPGDSVAYIENRIMEFYGE